MSKVLEAGAGSVKVNAYTLSVCRLRVKLEGLFREALLLGVTQ